MNEKLNIWGFFPWKCMCPSLIILSLFFFLIFNGKDLSSITTLKHWSDATYYRNTQILSAFKKEQGSFVTAVKQEWSSLTWAILDCIVSATCLWLGNLIQVRKALAFWVILLNANADPNRVIQRWETSFQCRLQWITQNLNIHFKCD